MDKIINEISAKYTNWKFDLIDNKIQINNNEIYFTINYYKIKNYVNDSTGYTKKIALNNKKIELISPDVIPDNLVQNKELKKEIFDITYLIQNFISNEEITRYGLEYVYC